MALKSNPFILAPMAGITDMPFRRLMKRMGAGAVVSEFVSAHACLHPSIRTKRYLAYHEEERPVGIQLFGGDPEILAKAAKIVEDTGVDFVDLNLGCPVPKVTRKGGGSAWLCRTTELGELFRTVRSAIQIPLTIKIRLGWDESTLSSPEIIRIAAEEGIAAVAVHGRTRAQGYSGEADWEFIRELAELKKVPIFGNGDVVSGPMAVSRLVLSGVDGVMIGRGALKNPWIFMEAMEALEQTKTLSDPDRVQLALDTLQKTHGPKNVEVPSGRHYYEKKIKQLQPKPVSFTAQWVKIRADRNARELIETHLGLLRETYAEERVRLHFRKFLAWYAAGYPGASQFRKFIFTQDHFPDVIQRSLEFFQEVQSLGDVAENVRENDPLFDSGHG
jgi:tRNA-dihydrouridine synthase B